MDRVVVVGASLAGMRTAESLRAAGFSGELTIVGEESTAPYDRPPLSKGFLEGKRSADQLSLSPNDPMFAALNATMLLGRQASALDLDGSQVVLSDGSAVGFDGLVIATGTRLRRLPGTDGNPLVHGIRTLDDSTRLRPYLVVGAHIVVIGAGFIGAEVASTARTLGCEVTVVEAMPVPLSRQLGDEMGHAVAGLHQRNGVQLITGVGVESINGSTVTLSDGTALQADAIVVGIGVQPNTEWLAGSGLELSNGVGCADNLRVLRSGAEIPNVVAVGDIARWTNPRFAHEGSVRVEHWTNAVETASHATQTLLGSPAPFAPVPYFWSDQYGKKIQFLGRAAGHDEVRVVSGSTDDKFLALYRRADQLVAALGVSSIKALMGYRQRLLDGCSWDDALAAAP
jgi:NADPH-dependent 2,4-dienoyl-CoA reductase/sulfur reductase-like enzyme